MLSGKGYGILVLGVLDVHSKCADLQDVTIWLIHINYNHIVGFAIGIGKRVGLS